MTQLIDKTVLSITIEQLIDSLKPMIDLSAESIKGCLAKNESEWLNNA